MLVQTRNQFERARTILMAAPYIVVDTETTGLLTHEGDRLCGIATYSPIVGSEPYWLAAYFPFRHKPGSGLFDYSENCDLAWMRELKSCFVREGVTLYFHNRKFDAQMLRHEGIDVQGIPFVDVLIKA